MRHSHFREALAPSILDLAVPILTFVFGETLLRGPAAVVSLHRLHNEFNGFPPDEDLLIERRARRQARRFRPCLLHWTP